MSISFFSAATIAKNHAFISSSAAGACGIYVGYKNGKNITESILNYLNNCFGFGITPISRERFSTLTGLVGGISLGYPLFKFLLTQISNTQRELGGFVFAGPLLSSCVTSVCCAFAGYKIAKNITEIGLNYLNKKVLESRDREINPKELVFSARVCGMVIGLSILATMPGLFLRCISTAASTHSFNIDPFKSRFLRQYGHEFTIK